MQTLLCTIFFLSGAAALIFEIIWFQLSGITFGNSVWASSCVLASFMGGLALGNGFSAQWGSRIKNAIRFYALLEISIALTGFALVIILPHLTHALSPIFRASVESPFLLNGLRLIISFVLMLIPTTAMGATLPILVKALYVKRQHFGRVLGALYGWNTLGAVAGVILCEFLLIRVIGLRGAGAVAAGLDAIAAVFALLIDHKSKSQQSLELPSSAAMTDGGPSGRFALLAASFLCGLSLLALEVIWFRFLIMFFTSTSWSFAIMLSVVLLGISAGGLLASLMFRLYSRVQETVMYFILANGVLIVILYANYSGILRAIEHLPLLAKIAISSIFLMLPICLISGIIYTLIGKLLFIKTASETKSAGLLTLANTIGGMLGSLIGGLILLPVIGVEKSFFILAIVYWLACIIVFGESWLSKVEKRSRKALMVCAVYAIVIFIFPFGFMKNIYLDLTLPKPIAKEEKRIGYREGITETIQYMRRDILNHPRSYRLVTNSTSMSGTNIRSKRYMKFFVYLPVALKPALQDALLIAYGCGSTAKALCDTKQLKNIDIVDISKDVLEMSSLVYQEPSGNPLNDSRVNVIVEDGRFFLLTTHKKYDLITAEPPPPINSGVVNLYTQEYFQLIYDALKPGGMVTYWLPVYQMRPENAKSILKAFSNAFETCSLWTGAGLEWMMVGVKKPLPRVSVEKFQRQWKDRQVLSEMKSLGFIGPGQLGSFFISDRGGIQNWVTDAKPLNDNFPHRLSPDPDSNFRLDSYYRFMDPGKCQTRFSESKLIDAVWPEKFKEDAIGHFALRATIDRLLAREMPSIVELNNCLKHDVLSSYTLWAFRSDQVVQDIINNAIRHNQFDQALQEEKRPDIYRHLAARAFQNGDYASAEKYLKYGSDAFLRPQSKSNNFYSSFRTYLLYLNGDRSKAKEVLSEYVNSDPQLLQKRTEYANSVWNYLVTLDVENR